MIAKLRGRSIAELKWRLVQQARSLAERRGFVASVVLPEGLQTEPRTPWPPLAPSAIVARLSDAERTACVARAERICLGRFDLLGLSELTYGTPINWQRDPLSGRSAALEHWSRVPYLDYEQVGDHKLIWEVNRHQWLLTLGQAWLVTGDARYAQTATELVADWLRANPAKRGINWCSALELAFRVMSWIHGLRFFAGAPQFTADLRRAMVASAALQVEHIITNISTWFSPNTHLTGEALAMLSVGCAWPELPRAARWRKDGWQILCDELPRQLRADGVYFEQSAWYQAYTVDFYLLGMQWARAAGLTIPAGMEERVTAAAAALRAVTRPDGTIAMLGDDDGGRTLPLTVGKPGDMTATLWRAAAELNDRRLIPPTDAARSALLWLDGPAVFDDMAARTADPEGRTSRVLRNGGWLTLTEQGATPQSDHWLVLDAGPHGALSFAHAHADALAIDLSVSGTPMLVDPGTGAYVGARRNRYRSTAVHNTVTVDGTDSSEQGTPFRWLTAASTHLAGAGATVGASFASAYHDGYLRLADPVRHHRTILRIDRHYWLMLDTLTANAPHRISLTLQGAGGALLTPRGHDSPTQAFVFDAGAARLQVALDPRLAGSVEESTVSPGYSAEIPAPALKATAALAGTATFCTVMGVPEESGDLSLSCDADAQVWRVRTGRGDDAVACPAGTMMTLGPARFDGAVLVVRGADGDRGVVAAGAGTLHLDGRAFSLRADDIRVAHRAPDGTWTMES